MDNKIQQYKNVLNYLNNVQNLQVYKNIGIKKIIIEEEEKKVHVKKEAKNGKV